MRKILFRGKSNYGNVGEWLYSMTISKHYYNDNEVFSYYIGNGNKTIDGKTLGQYTGLTDKNGTKIFEGDILKQGIGDNLVVLWNNEQARFDLFHNNMTVAGFNKPTLEFYEVIGNIHDNPELLRDN